MKNKMSVLGFSYRPLYYIKRPWKFFKEAYWNIRNFIHRGRFGFGYVDIWCMDEYLLDVIPMMLRHLADYSCGYPGVEPFDTPEKYKNFLKRLAEKFENCREENIDERNEYTDAFNNMMETARKREKDKNEYTVTTVNFTDEEKEIKNKYFNRMVDIQDERDAAIIEAYKELAENHNILWD